MPNTFCEYKFHTGGVLIEMCHDRSCHAKYVCCVCECVCVASTGTRNTPTHKTPLSSSNAAHASRTQVRKTVPENKSTSIFRMQYNALYILDTIPHIHTHTHTVQECIALSYTTVFLLFFVALLCVVILSRSIKKQAILACDWHVNLHVSELYIGFQKLCCNSAVCVCFFSVAVCVCVCHSHSRTCADWRVHCIHFYVRTFLITAITPAYRHESLINRQAPWHHINTS